MAVFIEKGDDVYLDIPYCEFYIPEYYFDPTKRFATDFGSTMQVFGLFNVGIFDGTKLKELKILNLPTRVTINVYDSDNKEILMSNGETVMCRVLKYIRGNKIMSSILFENFESGKEYLKILMTGNLPNIVPASKQKKVWKKNQKLNNISFGLSDLYQEAMLSTFMRAKSDLSKKYAKISNEPGTSEYDYVFASVRQVCQYNSTFTGLTYEDFDSMATTALNKSRNKTKEAYTPVEQIIKF